MAGFGMPSGGMRGGVHEEGQRRGFSLSTFSALGHPAYRLLFGGTMASTVSFQMQLVARSFFVYDLTDSALILGLVSMGFSIPMLAFSLFGGVLADRIEKRTIMVWGQLAAAIISLPIAILIATDAIHWLHLFAASLGQGVVFALMFPARQAIIPELVGPKLMNNAIALNSAGFNLNRVFGPVATGFLIPVIGVEGVYFIMTGAYLLAGVLAWMLPRTGAVALQGGPLFGDIKDGLRYIRRNEAVMILLVVALVTVLLGMPWRFLLPIFTEDIFHTGPQGLGVLFSISGVGAVVGSLLVGSLREGRRGLVLLGSIVLLGASLVLFTLTNNWYLAMAMMLPVGLGEAGRMVLSNSLVQFYTEDAYRGRVMSVYLMEFGLQPFGVMPASFIAETMGAPLAVGSLAALMALLAIVIGAARASIRNLR